MRRHLFIIITLLIPLFSLAQDIVYFDADWNPVDKKRSAAYYRPLPVREGNVYKLIDHYKNGKVQMSGYYKVNDPRELMAEPVDKGKRHGRFIYYYADGTVKDENEYADGQPHGSWKSYTEQGKLTSTAQYENGKKAGEWVQYYEGTDKVWFTINYIYDKMNGEVKSYYPDGNIKRNAVYTNGNLASGKMYDPTGGEIPFTPIESMPEPAYDLGSFLSQNIVYPAKARAKNVEGRVRVTFYVDESGRITNPVVEVPVHPLLDKEALRIVQTMPPWNPGKMDDKPVKVYFTLPIVFRLE